MNMNESIGSILPAYNEEDIIRGQLKKLRSYLNSLKNPYDIIVVENGSTDQTPEILEDLSAKFSSLSVIHLQKANYGRALRQGTIESKHDLNFFLNVDLVNIEFMDRALNLLEDYDLIVGSKRLDEAQDERSTFRNFLSWGLNSLLAITVGFEGTDSHGLKAFRRSPLEPIVKKSQLDRGMFDTEMIIRAERNGIEKKEIPITVDENRPARNFMVQKITQNLIDIVKLYRRIHYE